MGVIMGFPSPFEVSRQIGTNVSQGFRKVQDENAIETILSQAMKAGPEQLQNSIGQILSQVSPERQQNAIKYLENSYNNVLERQKQERLIQEKERQFQGARELGVNPYVHPTLQKAEYENNAKDKRIDKIYGRNNAQPPSPVNNPSDPFESKTDAELEVLTGHKDKEVSEPAKQKLKSRQEKRKIDQKNNSQVFKSDLDRSNKVKESAEIIAAGIPQKKTSLNLMKDAVSNQNLSYFSPDNLAEITGIEGLRSSEGSIFKTAGKEYFLGNISRAGARPNQWIEQQIADMMAKIGRSPEANISVLRALENELDLDEARVRFTEEISDRLTSEGDLSQGKLGTLVNKEMLKYAEKQQDVLFNDLRAIKAIAENKPQKFRKVEKGTQVSDYIAQALLKQFDNDPKKAAQEAKKLGYDFE